LELEDQQQQQNKKKAKDERDDDVDSDADASGSDEADDDQEATGPASGARFRRFDELPISRLTKRGLADTRVCGGGSCYRCAADGMVVSDMLV
jgi:hypothetical protein